MNQTKFLTLALACIFIGCRPLNNLSPKTFSNEPIAKTDFTKLNGKYSNIQDTVFGNIEHFPSRSINENDKRLLDRLFINYPKTAHDKKITVELKFISHKKATVNVYEDETLLLNKKIRGRFKNGYFYVRPKILVIPFFPIFYWHNFERIRIGKVGNDIVVDHSVRAWGFAIIAGGSDNGCSTSIYKRTDK